jgi:Tfp pilus assembly protein PilZ
MQILKMRFVTGDEALSAYRRDLPNGGLFVPTTTSVETGTEVVLELSVRSIPGKALLRGRVLSWRHALPRLRVRAGAVVEFLKQDAEKRDGWLAALAGTVNLHKRRHPRYPVTMPVTFERDGERGSHSGELAEISVGGAFLRMEEALPEIGDGVVVHVLLPGGAVPVPLQSKVATKNSAGVGIKFVSRDSGGSRRLRELIRRLKAS